MTYRPAVPDSNPVFICDGCGAKRFAKPRQGILPKWVNTAPPGWTKITGSLFTPRQDLCPKCFRDRR